jgi:cation diffusion facilitator family transporter
MNPKEGVARLSIISNASLIVLKTTVGLISGSVSIISEAIHSTMDLLAAIIAYLTVRISDNPPDERHPYGHGKFENISGVVEALLIFVAAIWIIVEAVKKIIHQKEIDSISLGFIVMLISAIVNTIVSRKLYKVARETDSVALEADALHLKTDVYTSAGVAAGLLVIWIADLLKIKGLHILDPIVAILVALLIIKESWMLLKNAYSPLLDTTLPEKDITEIHKIIERYCNENITYHDLRTRKAGNYRFIDFHLELPEVTTVKEAHDICDSIESEIESRFKNSRVQIHVEPWGMMLG